MPNPLQRDLVGLDVRYHGNVVGWTGNIRDARRVEARLDVLGACSSYGEQIQRGQFSVDKRRHHEAAGVDEPCFLEERANLSMVSVVAIRHNRGRFRLAEPFQQLSGLHAAVRVRRPLDVGIDEVETTHGHRLCDVT